MAYGKQSKIEIQSNPWDAAQRSFLAAEERMTKKWGLGAWMKMARPELAQKYRSARERYLNALRTREAGVVIATCENLVKGLKVIDQEISQEHKPDDVFYLHARIEGRNYYMVSDRMDMERVLPLMKGKDPVVFTLEEVATVLAAKELKEAVELKNMFPGAQIQKIEYHKEHVDDAIPF